MAAVMDALGVLLCYALAAGVLILCIAFVVMARYLQRRDELESREMH